MHAARVLIVGSVLLLSCAAKGDDAAPGKDGRREETPDPLEVCDGQSAQIGACIVEPPGYLRTGADPIRGLTVVEEVTADPSQCTFAIPVGAQVPTKLNTEATAWRLTDQDENSWVVVLGVASAARLEPGAVVELDYVSDYIIGGWILVMQEGAPAVFVADSYIPEALGVSLQVGQAECTVKPCWVRSSVLLTVGEDSMVLATDESGEGENLVFINDYYEPVGECPSTADARDAFVVAGYAHP